MQVGSGLAPPSSFLYVLDAVHTPCFYYFYTFSMQFIILWRLDVIYTYYSWSSSAEFWTKSIWMRLICVSERVVISVAFARFSVQCWWDDIRGRRESEVHSPKNSWSWGPCWLFRLPFFFVYRVLNFTMYTMFSFTMLSSGLRHTHFQRNPGRIYSLLLIMLWVLVLFQEVFLLIVASLVFFDDEPRPA